MRSTLMPLIPLLLGLLAAAVGVFSWRRGGARLVLAGLTLATMAGSMLLRDSPGPLRSATIALFAVVVFVTFAKTPPGVWRALRLELGLLTATGVTLAASYFLTDIPPQLQMALLVVLGILAVLSLAAMVRSLGRHRST